jgi:hypothetical protein
VALKFGQIPKRVHPIVASLIINLRLGQRISVLNSEPEDANSAPDEIG